MKNEASPSQTPSVKSGKLNSTPSSQPSSTDTKVKKKPPKKSKYKDKKVNENRVDKKKSKVSKKASARVSDSEAQDAEEKVDTPEAGDKKKKKFSIRKDDIQKLKMPWKYRGGAFLKFKRQCLFIVNIMVFFVGVIMVIFGVKSFKDSSDYEEITGGVLVYGGIALIITGSIVIFVFFLGLCGAITKNRCALILYVMILFLIFLLMIAVGTGLLILKDNPGDVKGKMVDKLIGYHILLKLRKTWNNLQINLECCGVEHGKGKKEWESAYSKFMASLGYKTWRNLPVISIIPMIANVTDDQVREILEDIKNNKSLEFPAGFTALPSGLTLPTIPPFLANPPWPWKHLPPNNSTVTPAERSITESTIPDNTTGNTTSCTNKTAHVEPYVVYPKPKKKSKNGTNETLPETPVLDVPPEICDKNKTDDIYQDGCLDMIMENGGDIGKLSIGLSVILLVGMLGACMIIVDKKYTHTDTQ